MIEIAGYDEGRESCRGQYISQEASDLRCLRKRLVVISGKLIEGKSLRERKFICETAEDGSGEGR